MFALISNLFVVVISMCLLSTPKLKVNVCAPEISLVMCGTEIKTINAHLLDTTRLPKQINKVIIRNSRWFPRRLCP